MGRIIGIDLDTANSVGAVVLDGKPTIIPSVEGERLFPSVVAVDPKTGRQFIGQSAKRQAVINPKRTIFSVKRFMGKPIEPAVQQMRQVVPDEAWTVGFIYCPRALAEFFSVTFLHHLV